MDDSAYDVSTSLGSDRRATKESYLSSNPQGQVLSDGQAEDKVSGRTALEILDEPYMLISLDYIVNEGPVTGKELRDHLSCPADISGTLKDLKTLGMIEVRGIDCGDTGILVATDKGKMASRILNEIMDTVEEKTDRSFLWPIGSRRMV